MTIQDQPAPTKTDGVPIWDLVIADVEYMWRESELTRLLIADMRERDRVGRERYGTPLQAHNGRDSLVDAYQEALDLCAYLRQAREELMPVTDLAYKAIQVASALRERIRLRDVEKLAAETNP